MLTNNHTNALRKGETQMPIVTSERFFFSRADNEWSKHVAYTCANLSCLFSFPFREEYLPSIILGFSKNKTKIIKSFDDMEILGQLKLLWHFGFIGLRRLCREPNSNVELGEIENILGRYKMGNGDGNGFDKLLHRRMRSVEGKRILAASVQSEQT